MVVYQKKSKNIDDSEVPIKEEEESYTDANKATTGATEQVIEVREEALEVPKDQGNRWTFVGVLPESSFIHTLHHGTRNLEEATVFIGKIKEKSDETVPLFSSDDWFYEKALLAHYGEDFIPPYKGRGRYPLPRRVPLPDLKYVQVQKKRNKQGRIESITKTIVYGQAEQINEVYAKASRCKTINTIYVESRNGKFRKDNARLIRRTLCHSKKSEFHDAQTDFVAQVMNYTRTNEALKIVINPDAERFQQKYQHLTPAMAENLIDKCLTIKELLFRRPRIAA